MDLNSLVKAYTSMIYSNHNHQQPNSNPIDNKLSTENPLKRMYSAEDQDNSEPEPKRRNTAFEPFIRPIVPQFHQAYRTPMNLCCSEVLQRYTQYIEKELVSEITRTTRQTLLNSYKFWHTIHPPPIQRIVAPANNLISAQNAALYHLNSLTNRIGQTNNNTTTTRFSSIQSLANGSSPPAIKVEPTAEDGSASHRKSTTSNEISSRGASVRKRKCKVTDIMADSPPTKSLSLSNGCKELYSPDYMNGSTSTLTSAHLRKAKLLFLYSRYPSSVNIKEYFPDVRFNKANTAQLVKWFSNFREYFYIQVEKFARQYASDPSIQVDDIDLDKCGEVLKNLNIHYNRSNRVDIPKNFVDAVIVALKEFFVAVRTGTDNESSWKKVIYKVVTRFDVEIPANMKTPDY